MIPKLIHQTAKSREIDPSWARYQEAVLKYHPEWSYKLWTDEDNIALLRENYPDMEKVYFGMPQPAMRADLMRYVYMEKFGGLYLDLDYQFLKPFDLNDKVLVLPRESNEDAPIYLGNCIFASIPGHPFWRALLEAIRRNPPTRLTVRTENDSTQQAGPGMVTRVWREQFPNDPSIFIPPRSWFHPVRPETGEELEKLKTRPETYGIHWCFGTWREWNLRARVKGTMKRLLGR
jgi:mannosyltransferase OCH1-like enzyme